MILRAAGKAAETLVAATAAGAAAGDAAIAVATGAAACASAGAAATLAPVSITAMISCALTVEPSGRRISVITPESGAGNSSTTLSVSTSIRFSSRLTGSPAFLCQLTSVASTIDSGRTGTFTSMSMLRPVRLVRSHHFAQRELRRKCVLHQLLLLREMFGHVAHGRRRRNRPAGVGQHLLIENITAQVGAQSIPCALILRLFLAPHDFGGGRKLDDLRLEVIVRKRILLLETHDGD